MKCPRDGQALVFVDDGRHLRDRCPGCEGVLLDRSEVVAALGSSAGGEVTLAAARLAGLPPGTLACPRDGKTLHRLDHRGIELDLCPECNALWLDAGEMEKVRSLKRPKGTARKAAAAAGAMAAGAAVAAAADKPSLVSGLGELAGEVAIEEGIDLVFEFAIDAVGALVEGLLS